MALKKYGVFYGREREETDGKYINDEETNIIWISESLVNNYKTRGIEIMRTIFHEMNHLLVEYNISHNQIDYYTFMFIEDNFIERYNYLSFYEDNYDIILEENDSRINEVLETYRFMDSDQEIIKYVLKKSYEIKKNRNKKLYCDSKKRIITQSTDKSKARKEDYIGEIIRNKKNVLQNEFEILKIKYDNNGKEKSLRRLLDEFFDLKEDKIGVSFDNLYSIYYGIIKHKVNMKSENLDEKYKKKLNDFFNMNMVSIQSVIINQKEGKSNIETDIGRADYTAFLKKTAEYEK